MTPNPEEPIDWSLTTWKGSRRQQHQQFLALPFARKLELIEEMTKTASFFGTRPVATPPPSVRNARPKQLD